MEASTRVRIIGWQCEVHSKNIAIHTYETIESDLIDRLKEKWNKLHIGVEIDKIILTPKFSR